MKPIAQRFVDDLLGHVTRQADLRRTELDHALARNADLEHTINLLCDRIKMLEQTAAENTWVQASDCEMGAVGERWTFSFLAAAIGRCHSGDLRVLTKREVSDE